MNNYDDDINENVDDLYMEHEKKTHTRLLTH